MTVSTDVNGDAVLTFPNGEFLTFVGVNANDINDPLELEAIGIPLPVATNSTLFDMIQITGGLPTGGDSLGSRPINPALLVCHIFPLNRRNCAGIMVLFQARATHSEGKYGKSEGRQIHFISSACHACIGNDPVQRVPNP